MSHAEDTIVSEADDTVEEAQPAPELVEGDSLVEEVSIDGMCGVY